MSGEQTKCRSCGADVVFYPSFTTSKSMILDAKPVKRVVLVTDSFKRTFAKVVDTYTPHHATCPKVDEWRKPRDGA